MATKIEEKDEEIVITNKNGAMAVAAVLKPDGSCVVTVKCCNGCGEKNGQQLGDIVMFGGGTGGCS